MTSPAFAALFTYDVTNSIDPNDPPALPLASYTVVFDTEASTATISANNSSINYYNPDISDFKGGETIPQFDYDKYFPNGTLIFDNDKKVNFGKPGKRDFLNSFPTQMGIFIW